MPISFLSYLSYLYFISYFFSGTTWTKFSTFSQRFFSRALSKSQRGSFILPQLLFTTKARIISKQQAQSGCNDVSRTRQIGEFQDANIKHDNDQRHARRRCPERKSTRRHGILGRGRGRRQNFSHFQEAVAAAVSQNTTELPEAYEVRLRLGEASDRPQANHRQPSSSRRCDS